MINKIKLLVLTVFLISISAVTSKATIIFQGVESQTENSGIGFTEVNDLESPNGLEGDFEVLACAIPDEDVLTMNPATPGWSVENIGKCTPEACILGIFSRFSESTGGDFSTCSWGPVALRVFAGGILRYSGVDPDNPIIALECNADVSVTATAPSVVTEDNSVAIRIFAAVAGLNEGQDFPDFGFGQFLGTTASKGEIISIFGVGQPFPVAGDTGTLSILLADTSFWRACTIAIRMDTGAPLVRNIPTISEWGLIAMATILGIVGFMVMRRRKAAA